MKTKTLTAAALILAALPALSWAQQGGMQGGMQGQMQGQMRPQMPALDFATADADGSGGISAEEWTAYTQTLRDAMRAQMLGARADALIAAADANGDGSLTRDEIIAGYTALGDQRREMRGPMAEGRGPGMMRGEMRGEGRGDGHGIARVAGQRCHLVVELAEGITERRRLHAELFHE